VIDKHDWQCKIAGLLSFLKRPAFFAALPKKGDDVVSEKAITANDSGHKWTAPDTLAGYHYQLEV